MYSYGYKVLKNDQFISLKLRTEANYNSIIMEGI